MAKIALISLNLTDVPAPVYPLGVTLLAEALRREGHETLELDILPEGEAALEKCLAWRPDAIGFSLRNADLFNPDGADSALGFYENVFRKWRPKIAVPIILGGSGFSLFPERFMERLGADYGVIGEGESVLPELVKSLQRGERPAIKILKAETPIDGKNLLTPTRPPELVAAYLRRGAMLNIQTKRGCPRRCAYCAYPLLEGATYRFRDADAVIAEIAELKRRHGADYFFFADSVFNDAEGQWLDVVEKLATKKLDISWMAYFRPEVFAAETVALLKRSGLRAIEWGTDAASDAALAGLRKDFTWETVMAANERVGDSGIPQAHFILFGGPGETPETLEEGLRNIARLSRRAVFASIGVRVYPKTHLAQIALRDGAIAPNADLTAPIFYLSPAIDKETLKRRIQQAFSGHPELVYAWNDFDDKARALRALGHKGPGWDLLLSPTARRRRS